MLRTIVIGSGAMARRRATALLNTGVVELCGVASASAANAKHFAQQFKVPYCTTDYKTLAERNPQVALIEVPHHIQDEAVIWALQHNMHVLIGSCLATEEAAGNAIRKLAAEKNGSWSAALKRDTNTAGMWPGKLLSQGRLVSLRLSMPSLCGTHRRTVGT